MPPITSMLRERESSTEGGRRDGGGGTRKHSPGKMCTEMPLRKEVSPPLKRKSHNGISDGKNVFFSDERKIKRAQPNVKDDK